MTGDRYTLLLVPEKDDKTRRFRFSRRRLWSISMLFVVTVVGGFGSLFFSVNQFQEVADLTADNEQMRSERSEVVQMIRDLRRIQEMDAYVRQSLGVSIAEEAESGEAEQPEAIPVSYLENIPSHMPAFGFVTQPFSEGSVSGQQDHTGLDVAAPARTAVHAAADGLVIFSGWQHPYGNLIVIYHGNDYFSLYGHNAQNLVSVRQRVDRGKLIALLGETGVTSGPHLHFEIWKDGTPVDPALFIPEYGSDYMTHHEDEKR